MKEHKKQGWVHKSGDFRSNFFPIQEGGCIARFRVSDTRCGTYVICPAYLQSRSSTRAFRTKSRSPSCRPTIRARLGATRAGKMAVPLHDLRKRSPGAGRTTADVGCGGRCIVVVRWAIAEPPITSSEFPVRFSLGTSVLGQNTRKPSNSLQILKKRFQYLIAG